MTSVHIILDESGSMFQCVDDTIGGYNHYINEQKTSNSDGNVSLYLFSNDYKIIYQNKKIDENINLSKDNYSPGGSTSLLDAIGNTINNVTDDKPIIVILTDGYENSSTSYTKAHVKDLIKMKEDIGWKFIFLGANQDAIVVASQFGINENTAMTFNQGNVHETFEGLSAAISRQQTGEDDQICFTGLERAASQPYQPVQSNNDRGLLRQMTYVTP